MGYQSVMRLMRGQVWMVKEDFAITKAKLERGDRTEAYTRPYVIITSQDDLNNCDGMIQCYPITSKIGVKTGNDIIFRNHKFEQNKIVTNQIQTRDVRNFMSYMFTMPDDIMNELDMIGAKRQGLTSIITTLDKEIKRLQAELDKLKCEGLEIIDNMIPNIVIGDISNQLSQSVSEICATEEIDGDQVNNQSSTYHKWTEDSAREYLSDYESMDKQEIMDKYGLERCQLSRTRSYLLRKIGGGGTK